ncbi:MAG: tetratricopeptide repeat protein [Candidatus Cloacimonetes bacterium]|nr:tetratricopeptide repeat protein [Candidatus Cloacimonadota bacterium]
MNKKTLILLIVVFLCFVFTSCSQNKTIQRMPSDEKWRIAEEYFNRGKFNRAIPYYQQLVLERSSFFVADAQFKLGECYFNRGGRDNFIDAIFEYQEFLRLFADHRLAADAQFRIAQSYSRLSLSAEYTQEDTNRAIEHFTRFTERYPTDSRVSEAYTYIAEMQMKILEKVYLNGYIYYKTRDYPASELYLDEIIALGHRNDLEKMSWFYKALIHIDRRESEEAMTAIETLQRYFPESKEVRKAETRFKRMNSRFFRFIYSL